MKLTHENLKRYTDEYGNVNLSDTNVTELPDELHVKGWLNLSGCSSLTHLPDGLVVGWLDLNGCKKLTHLPDGLVVGGSLDLSGCKKLTQLLPKEAARIFMRVTDVHVKPLQDIDGQELVDIGLFSLNGLCHGRMKDKFLELEKYWDSAIKPADRALYGWDANPWIFIISFEKCGKPIEW